MEERKQFTFFVSYWQAIEELPEKDQLPILKAIIKYALFGEEPTALRGVRRAVFLLVKPTLDSSRKKSASGKQGGSKPKAKGKKIPKEEDIEGENEAEVEMEYEYESKINGGDGESAGAREAGESELASIGLKPGEYLGVSAGLVRDVQKITMKLFGTSTVYDAFDARNVFRRVALANENGWMRVYLPAVGLLEYALEAAAYAGQAKKWSYIDGVLDRLRARGIQTADQAREWDEDRPDKEI